MVIVAFSALVAPSHLGAERLLAGISGHGVRKVTKKLGANQGRTTRQVHGITQARWAADLRDARWARYRMVLRMQQPRPWLPKTALTRETSQTEAAA
jgi:hypothetical protein